MVDVGALGLPPAPGAPAPAALGAGSAPSCRRWRPPGDHGEGLPSPTWRPWWREAREKKVPSERMRRDFIPALGGEKGGPRSPLPRLVAADQLQLTSPVTEPWRCWLPCRHCLRSPFGAPAPGWASPFLPPPPRGASASRACWSVVLCAGGEPGVSRSAFCWPPSPPAGVLTAGQGAVGRAPWGRGAAEAGGGELFQNNRKAPPGKPVNG